MPIPIKDIKKLIIESIPDAIIEINDLMEIIIIIQQKLNQKCLMD